MRPIPALPPLPNLPLAVATMVFDEADYLAIWLRHWRRHVEDRALFVLIDGPNPELEAMAAGVNVIVCDRPPPYERMEDDRWVMLAAVMSALTERARVVVYTDVDEILVVDPALGIDLVTLLARTETPVANPLGLEIIHRADREPGPIDLARPILAQRQHYRTSFWFSKPAIITRPVRWSRGGHFSDQPGPVVTAGLYNIHLNFYDNDRFFAKRARRAMTTLAPHGLDASPRRKWRRDEAAARAMIDGFQRMPVLPGRTLLWAWLMRQKARRLYSVTPVAEGEFAGLIHHPVWNGRSLHRLPRRFATLF